MKSIKIVFSIDLRTLALFRVCLAILLLVNLCLLSADIIAFYTDDGVLTRRYWAIAGTNRWYFSLHAASGELWWQIILFIISGLCAIGLLIGYRTKLMAILSWLLLVSLLNRNGFILQAGDQLLVIMCFWSMFLPIHAHWSIDAALQPHNQHDPNQILHDPLQPQLYFSVATVAVILQVLYLYIFTALLKTGDAWRVTYDAAYHAVSLQHFATPIGNWFKQFPELLRLSTRYVLYTEMIAPILVLLPFWFPKFRVLGLLMLASLHIAFMLMLHIGLFPLIDLMSLSLLTPSAIWVWLAQKKTTKARYKRKQAITLYYDQDCGFCLKMCLILRTFLLPSAAKILPAQQYSDIYPIMQQQNSWVITDSDENIYTKSQAIRFLLLQTWLFKPVGWLLKLPPLMILGNWAYHHIANNRKKISDMTATWLKYKPINLKPRLTTQIITAICLAIITLFNIGGLEGYSDYRNDTVKTIAKTLRINQHWNMFAPFPLRTSIYPAIRGTLRNGELVNLYPQTSVDTNWQPPEDMYALYKNYRWRKYMGRVHKLKSNTIRKAYGIHLCKQWNHKNSPKEQELAIIEIFFTKHYTNITNTPKKRTQKRIWRHWCFPEYREGKNLPST